LSITRAYISHSPESDSLLDDLVTSLCALGDLALLQGQGNEAMRYREEAILGLEKLVKSRPEEPWYREQLKSIQDWIETQRKNPR